MAACHRQRAVATRDSMVSGRYKQPPKQAKGHRLKRYLFHPSLYGRFCRSVVNAIPFDENLVTFSSRKVA
jgi:hypothetical protein